MVNIHAYWSGKVKKLAVVDGSNTDDIRHVVADSTDMARLWRVVRNMQGDRSAFDSTDKA